MRDRKASFVRDNDYDGDNDNDNGDDDDTSGTPPRVRVPLHTHTRTHTRHAHSHIRRSVIFISRVTPRTWKARAAVSAAPRAPPISSFKIILRPEGHSALSYPPRQITLARHLAPTAAGRTECGNGREQDEVMERHGWAEGRERRSEREKTVRQTAREPSPLFTLTRLLLDLINNSRCGVRARARARQGKREEDCERGTNEYLGI